MLMKNLVTGVFTGITLLLGASAWAAETPAAAPAYAAKGEQTCLKCHDESPTVDILKTPHAMKADSRTPFANHGCETCHGASPEHVASAAKVKEGQKPVEPAVMFSGPNAASAKDRAAVCLGCHEYGSRINWHRGRHEANEVACNNCHTIHGSKDPVLVNATQPEKCFTCHAQQRAQSFQYSHHPIREGKVVCADCHSVHGSPSAAPGMLKEITLNETCYNCHADKRGPLLFEHQPVRENCDYCHTPHGSPNPRLVADRLPFMCTSCHAEDSGGTHSITNATRSSSTSFFGGAGSLGNAPLFNTAQPGGTSLGPNNTLQTRACTNCHSQIHGSNSPNGFFFFR